LGLGRLFKSIEVDTAVSAENRQVQTGVFAADALDTNPVAASLTGQSVATKLAEPQRQVAHMFGLFRTKEQREAASLRRLTQRSISNMERLCASGKIDASDLALVERHIAVRKSRLENLRRLESGEKLSELENTPSSLRWHQSRRDALEIEATVLSQTAEALIKHLRQNNDQ
jgi:hypothetical protein